MMCAIQVMRLALLAFRFFVMLCLQVRSGKAPGKNKRKEVSLMKKIVSLLVALVLALSVCSAFAEGIADKTYTAQHAGLIEQMGWYTVDTYTLRLHGDGTYELVYRFDAFGSADLDTRGTRTMILTGTWTDADPEDEENSHRDVTLSAAQRVYFTQIGKIFGRSGGDKIADTDNWTDEMTEKLEMDRDAFMATYGPEYVVTIEEPTLDPMDETLIPQIYEIEINLPAVNG